MTILDNEPREATTVTRSQGSFHVQQLERVVTSCSINLTRRYTSRMLSTRGWIQKIKYCMWLNTAAAYVCINASP